MKVTDTFWEMRNLGVSSNEIQIDENDDIELLEEAVKNSSVVYSVAKVCGLNEPAIAYLQQNGYQYSEDQIKMEHDLHEVVRNRVMQKLYDALDYKVMNEEEIEELYGEINKGMFYTDRISGDPHFSSEIAAKRYINWIGDLLENGATAIVMKYKQESTGFFIIQRDDEKTFHSILGGGYEKYTKTGMGTVLKEMEYVKKLGGKRVYTSVSSNNIRQFRNLAINGYIPIKVEHVFTKYS